MALLQKKTRTLWPRWPSRDPLIATWGKSRWLVFHRLLPLPEKTGCLGNVETCVPASLWRVVAWRPLGIAGTCLNYLSWITPSRVWNEAATHHQTDPWRKTSSPTSWTPNGASRPIWPPWDLSTFCHRLERDTRPARLGVCPLRQEFYHTLILFVKQIFTKIPFSFSQSKNSPLQSHFLVVTHE